MKKFRMMLPMLAFVFAAVGAVAGNFLAPISAYYQLTATTCSGAQATYEQNCQLDAPFTDPICTIVVNGLHKQAFKNSDCTGILRDVQPQ